MGLPTPGRLRALTLGIASVTTLALVLTLPTAADADVNPHDGLPATVSSGALPTPQIDGVVWTQVIVGDTVYVGGHFHHARPNGARKGTKQVTRNNFLAYTLSTGALLPYAPSFNSEIRGLAASTDGSRIYATGNFTAVNGHRRTRVAALTDTGAVTPDFTPSLNHEGWAIAYSHGSVYVGGEFTSANGHSRHRAAAFSATGGLRAFAPNASRTVRAIVVSDGGGSVVIGGNFGSVNGKTAKGTARVDSATGRHNQSWSLNKTVGNNTENAAITSLASYGGSVYGTGFSFHPKGVGGNRLEGAFKASWSGGGVQWIEDCHGDSYSIAPTADVVYVAGHAHTCSTVGSFGSSKNPEHYQRGMAFTQAATHKLKANHVGGYSNFGGKPAPTVLDWFPDFNTGHATGQNQGPWSVATNGKWVVYGGEFTTVNGNAQQGLTRFALTSIVPDKDGPRLSGAKFNPTLKALGGGKVSVTWKANYDRDNEFLTYSVIVDGDEKNPVNVQTRGSKDWFYRPTFSFTASGLTPGAHRFRLKVSDPAGNTQYSLSQTITVK